MIAPAITGGAEATAEGKPKRTNDNQDNHPDDISVSVIVRS